MLLNLLFENPVLFILEASLLVIAIAVHEFSHAISADRLGDPTPRLQGRVTLDPRAHLDPVGTLLLLLVGFGWGKPVMFDPYNLRNPKRDAALISFAGPASNFIMAILASILMRLFLTVPFLSLSFSSLFFRLTHLFIYYNILLGIFNLLPIHPLDGFKVVGGLLPKHYYDDWMDLARYGFIFLLFLIFPFFGSSPLFSFLNPVINFFINLLIPGKIGGII